MKKPTIQRKTYHSGFTLIEVFFVIIIIMIFVAILFPTFLAIK
ncbi:prepilin-type N-terminal cleavage/methylation domain-containing protein [Armatimonas sp.]